jgi:predicted RecA/RadA family phage recombinase
MKNFVQDGEVIPVTAPRNVNSGEGVLVGALFGVATTTVLSGASLEIVPEGVFDLAAATADTATQGAKMYWDDTAHRLTTTATNNTLVGALTAAKANGDTTARVYLDGVIR